MALSSAAAAPAAVSSGERWPPLESSPDVFNQLMWSLGVPKDEAEFHDVYGLDDDALGMVPQPVLAVILCFPDQPQGTRGELYFIKQIESLGNACGTIALLHALGNTYAEISLLEGSCLDVFIKSTASMDPYERAVFLEKDEDMAKAHSLAASAGDTELCGAVEEHYICFMAQSGTLYELDGMKHGPVNHGSSSPKSLLQDAVHIIKAIMQDIPNSMNFNVMVLSKKKKWRGDIF